VVRRVQRLDGLGHRLRAIVLIHRWIHRRNHLASRRIRLAVLGNGRSSVVSRRLLVVHGGFLTDWGRLLVVRLLIALLIRHVTVRLTHVHVGLALVVVMVRLVRVRCLRWLHNGSRRRGSKLVLVLTLAGSIRGHLRVTGRGWWSHLLITIVCLIALSHFIHAGATRRSKRSVASVGNRPGTITIIHTLLGIGHDWLLSIGIRGGSTSGLIIRVLLIIVIPFLGSLVLTTAHTDITTDTDTAALLSDHAAKGSALGKSRELLRREDSEGQGLDLQTVGNVGIDASLGMRSEGRTVIGIHILRILQFLIEREAQAIFALVANRQVGEDKVARRAGAVQIGHTSDRSTGQDWEARRRSRRAARSNGPGILQSREKEEVGIVSERDFSTAWALAFIDTELDNGRRVHWTTIGRGCRTLAFANAVHDADLHFAPDPHALARSGC